MNDLGLRIGDSEREQAAADLSEHFALGRLSADEHGGRLDVVYAARTRSDLLPVFADLPGPYAVSPATRPPATRPPSPRRQQTDDRYWSSGPRAFRHGVPTPIVVVLALLLVLTVVTHLPFVLAGIFVAMFVTARHRGPRARRRW